MARCQEVADKISRFASTASLFDGGGSSFALALFGDQAAIEGTVIAAKEAFRSTYGPQSFKRLGSGSGGSTHLKRELARFVRRRDEHEERYRHDPGYSLVVLDGFEEASAADVSSLHGAWEKERPVLRYQGDMYDISGLIFMTIFRGEALAQRAQHDGWKAAIEAFYESNVLGDAANSASDLTPEAAVGRMSGGVVLRALAADEVLSSGIPVDCTFELPGGGLGGSKINVYSGGGQDGFRSWFVGGVVLLLLFVFGWRRVNGGRGGGERKATCLVADKKRAVVRNKQSVNKQPRPSHSDRSYPEVAGSNTALLKVKELQAELKRRGEKTSGLKADLVKRLERSMGLRRG